MKLTRRNFLKLFSLTPLAVLPKVEFKQDKQTVAICIPVERVFPDKVNKLGTTYPEVDVTQRGDAVRSFSPDIQNAVSEADFIMDGNRWVVTSRGVGKWEQKDGVTSFVMPSPCHIAVQRDGLWWYSVNYGNE